ncbi:MAG: serine/threonine protein kinase [Ahniella sp.]|nr:serine/threonine protein kinase [Ahniella sp.]
MSMTPERFQQVRIVFESALAQDPSGREAWLAKACAGDDALLEAVQRMLAADAHAESENESLIDLPDSMAEQVIDSDTEAGDALHGKRFGPYTLIRTLGQGGMGQVYLAERSDGSFRQEVAVKVVREGWDHLELLERFRRERQILASLNHPNIARLLDGGASDTGEPYLVMEYVDGVSIGEYCDRERLSIPARVRLFSDVCAAVGYAHQRLVVHRDLKPSNILVTRDGTVKLLDFGIARLLAADATITAPRDRLFTIGYAAPEQIRGEIPSVSVDVYALGLLLYELLTGQRAYGRTASTPAAYEREVLTVEPTPPSRAAADLTDATCERAASRGLAPAHWPNN